MGQQTLQTVLLYSDVLQLSVNYIRVPSEDPTDIWLMFESLVETKGIDEGWHNSKLDMGR